MSAETNPTVTPRNISIHRARHSHLAQSQEIDGENYIIVLSTGSFLIDSGTTVFAGFAKLFDRSEAAQSIQAL